MADQNAKDVLRVVLQDLSHENAQRLLLHKILEELQALNEKLDKLLVRE